MLEAYDPSTLLGSSDSSSGIGDTEDLRLKASRTAFDNGGGGGGARLADFRWVFGVNLLVAGKGKSGIVGIDAVSETADRRGESSFVTAM